MGYATTLYAVDLGELRSAVGSGNAALVGRARAVLRESGAEPARGPRVRVTRDSRIVFEGRPVTPEGLREALRDPRWDGTELHYHHERGHKTGAFAEPGRFVRTLGEACAGARSAGVRIAAVVCCGREEELLDGDGEGELSDEQAAADLVAGIFTRPGESYGYGLKLLCEVLGTRLGVIEGKGRLKALGLGTPLADDRSPVPMPESGDFPRVGFLTAEEVLREAGRLGGTDLAYPRNAAVERDRRALLAHLRAAADQGHAVVAFYH